MTLSKFAASMLVAVSILSVQAIDLFSLAISLGLSFDPIHPLRLGSAAVAGQTLRYVPPKLPSRRGLRGTQGAGSRGGEEALPVQVSLLAPIDHTGQTTLGRPTFFWYVSNASSAPLQFTLIERRVAQPILVKQMQVKQAGIVKLEMPKGLPELQPGKEYRWTVSLVRDPLRPSMNPMFQAFITRGVLTPEQAKQLKAATSVRDRATIYAQAGIWYDALETIATPYLDKPDPSTRTDLAALLTQIGLPQVLDQR